MMLFWKKKEEIKKELKDIQQIKESISASVTPTPSTPHAPEPLESPENPEVEASSATVDWMKEFESGEKIPEPIEVPEDPKEWTSQQITMPPPMPASLPESMPGPIPKVQTLQTPNVPVVHKRHSTVLAHKNPMGAIPESAPLFIKLDRYKNILNTISDLRSTVSKVRSALQMFGEMERVKGENLRVIEAVIQKVEARIVDLDTEFIKPVENLNMRGEEEPENESWQPAQQPADDNLHQMIQNLHGEIGKLKEELNQMGAEDKKLVEEIDD
jgi:predicted transcriptional regulator